jgi:hypothetical protein
LDDKLRESYDVFLKSVVHEARTLQDGGIPLHIFLSAELDALYNAYCERLKERHQQNFQLVVMPHILGNTILSRLFELNDEGIPFEEVIESVFSEFETSTLKIPRTNRSWAYLHQFDSDLDEIPLDGSLVIRRITFFERILFESDNESSWGISKAKYIIESKPDVQISAENMDESNPIIAINNQKFQPRNKIRYEFLDIVNVLRLIKPSNSGITEINFEFASEQNPTKTIGISFPAPSELNPNSLGSHSKEPCFIGASTIEYMNQLLQRYRDVKKKGDRNRVLNWHRAVRRLNSAIISGSLEDMIVDLVIGLEILFKMTGFRMVFYASHLTGLSSIEKRHAVEIFDRAYNIRSRIVHGGSLKDDDVTTIQQTVELVARLLIFALSLGCKEDLAEIVTRAVYDSKEMQKLTKTLEKWKPP